MSLPTRSRVSLTLASCALVATLACGGGSGGGGSSPTSPDTNTASSNTQVNTTAPVLSVAFVPTSQAAAFWVFGTKLPSGYGHMELLYDFREGGEAEDGEHGA